MSGRAGATSWWRRAEALHAEFFVAKWRSGVRREARREEELLLALVFLDALGVENPDGYAALDLHPEMVASFHRWHRRAGLERFPTPGVCC